MSRKQKRMGPVGCFGQIENIKRQSLMYSKELRNINCLILFIAYKVKISFKLKSQALNLAGMRRGL